MIQSKKKEYCFFKLFDQFIRHSKTGKRIQPNGKRISKGTLANYGYTGKLLVSFASTKALVLRIRSSWNLNRREILVEKNYWKRFYKSFTGYLYEDCGYYDNYVGLTIKNIRVFFNYLNKDLGLGTGDVQKFFYIRKEEIPIFPLATEELNFLITNTAFENSLSKRMKEVKDLFVFGCSVALRVSDLLQLKTSNIRIVNQQRYLSVRSVKTGTDTLVKLPPFAVEIIQRNSNGKKLLPRFNKTNLNKYIKQLLELAGLTYPVSKVRNLRGISIELKNDVKRFQPFRFCDMATTHTMRRTAITTTAFPFKVGIVRQMNYK